MSSEINKNNDLVDKKNLDELSKILNLKYAAQLQDRFFSISCHEEKNMVHIQVLLQNSDESFFYPVEACLNGQKYKQSNKDLALILLDYLDVYFDSFFKEDENLFVPIDWAEHQFEGVLFQMKGQVFNRYQELKANELLQG